MTHIFFHQDGADFYNNVGICIFTASIKVLDLDCEAADKAYLEFEEWCKSYDLKPVRED